MTWRAARATVTGAMRNAAAQGNRAPDSAGAEQPRDVGVAASPHRRLFPTLPLPLLPPPAQAAGLLRATSFPDDLCRDARDILAHRFPLLGLTIETGPEIRWRRDYVSGRETGCPYFQLVPYLDAARAGDHKIVWELNRHQHLVLLAQLYLFDADPQLLTEIWRELESWLDANPFQRAVN